MIDKEELLNNKDFYKSFKTGVVILMQNILACKA